VSNTIAHTEHLRSRLSTLWVFLMLNMAFADILGFMYPGALQRIIAGDAGGIQMTPAFLLLAAVMTEIPIAMVFLSRWLKGRASIWVNVGAAVFTIAYVVGLGSLTAPYIFFAAIEAVCGLSIIWLAWRGYESQPQVSPAGA
jgi:hypothetical protein